MYYPPNPPADYPGYFLAEQVNGELLRVEDWAYWMWRRREMRDPLLVVALDNAIDIRRPRWLM